MVAFLASFLALNLLGQTHGEVGRLWLFLLPLVAIAAVIPLQRWYGKHSAIPALVLTLQLITALLTFLYQDFPY
jgi:hypothetical protein